MKLRVLDVVYPGKALCRMENNKTVFVDEGIDGELIEAEIIKSHKKYDEARLLNVIEPSPHRVSPKCSHYRLCSVYQVMDYDYQVRIKLRQLVSMLKGIYSQKIYSCLPNKRFYYRNKAVLHIDWENNILGYKDDTGRIVDASECFLLSEPINNTLSKIREVIWNSPYRGGFDRIGLRSNAAGEVMLILFVSDEKDDLPKDVVDVFSGIPLKGIVRVRGLSVKPYLGDDWLEEDILGKKFRYYGDGFFQVNTEMAQVLVEVLRKEALKKDVRVVLDLFCGVGLLGLSMVDMVRWVFGVEQAAISKKALDINSSYAGFGNFSFKLASASSVVWEIFEDKTMRRKIDTVIVDPPRKGLSKSIREFLRKNSKVKNLFYVSCDPMTLRRDLLELKSVYKIDKVYFLDFFPNTGHIESLSILRRRK